MTGEPRPVDRGFALLDPLLLRPELVVEAHDGPVCPDQGGNDESQGKEFPAMMLDPGDHPARLVPRGGAILKAALGTDLAAALGHVGDPQHPAAVAAIE